MLVQVTIPMKEVSAITKEKTARVIPNAIQVSTDKDKYFFTSFTARDKTFMMLFRLWQNVLMEQVIHDVIFTGLQILTGSILDNLKEFVLNSSRKHIVWVLIRTISKRPF